VVSDRPLFTRCVYALDIRLKQRLADAKPPGKERALHGSPCFLREAVAEVFNRA
jgi:hypothetical protein